MPRYYLDSSALIKRYHHESGSADVEALFNAPGNRFLISRLSLVVRRGRQTVVEERQWVWPDGARSWMSIRLALAASLSLTLVSLAMIAKVARVKWALELDKML